MSAKTRNRAPTAAEATFVKVLMESGGKKTKALLAAYPQAKAWSNAARQRAIRRLLDRPAVSRALMVATQGLIETMYGTQQATSTKIDS